MSALCAVHCAITPMLATLLPVVGLGILADEVTEIVLLTASAVLGITSLSLGYRVHRSTRAVSLLAAGLCLLGSGRFAEGSAWESIGVPMIVIGGLVVASSHLMNHLLCRSCRSVGFRGFVRPGREAGSDSRR